MKQGWKIKKLGDITTSINGLWTGKKPPFITIAVIRNTNFTKDCKLDTSDIAYIDVEVKQYASRKLQCGDIIIEKSGGSDKQPVGRPILFNIEEGEYSFSNFTSTLRVSDKTTILPEFIHRYLAYIYMRGDTAAMQSKTTGIRNLDFNLYKSINIPVPPIEEQERIVAELDCLSGVIERKREQLRELDALAESIFYQMFGDPITNEKGWEVKKWKDMLTIVNGKNQKTVENPDGAYPIYGSGGIMGYADKYLCPKNTIIIGRKGNINKPIFVKEPFWNVDTAFGLIADNIHIAPSYLFFYCRIFNFEQLNKAVTIPSLTKSDLLELNTPCPPLALQQQFAERIDIIEQQKELINKSIAQTEELFNARMDYYFS